MISIIQGDVIEVLRDYPDESFTCALCDPPYGLKFMGKAWDHGVPASPYWAEILRVLKPGAILMAFSGTRTWHRLGVAIEDAGFELFDTMMWLHGQGMPKSHNIGKAIDKAAGTEREVVGKYVHPRQIERGTYRDEWPTGSYNQSVNTNIYSPYEGNEKHFAITAPATDAAKIWEGYGTNLKPSFEPILLARKPRNTTFAQTAMEHGSSALNIDGCRIPSAEPYVINTWDDGAKPFGDGAGHPFTSRQQSGRWPANVVFSHSPECKKIGTKKVKGSGAFPQQHGTSMFVQSETRPQRIEMSDPDGFETVEAWECIEGCPVNMLNAQSGECGNKWKKNYGKKYADEGLQYGGGIFGGGGYLGNSTYSDKGGAARYFRCFEGERFFYTPKANKKERDAGLEELSLSPPPASGRSKPAPGRQSALGAPRRNSHTTVKPLALCKYLATLIIPPEEYRDEANLLIPFAGVLSEAIGALLAGWRNITAIELEKEYCNIGQKRINWWFAKIRESGLTDPKAILKTCLRKC